MKRITMVLALILFLISGCGESKQSGIQNEGFITVDVTAKYPKKELILQDFLDVEYVPLETRRDFITMAHIEALSKNLLIVRNRNRSADGDIFFFDRNGTGVRKINRLGQSAEEYLFLLGVTLDEGNGEIFVNDYWKSNIFVYDLFGNFKRSFKYQEATSYNNNVYNPDQDNLIYHNMVIWMRYQETYF